LEVGRSILAFMLYLARRFPTTTFGALADMRVSSLGAEVQIFGSKLKGAMAHD